MKKRNSKEEKQSIREKIRKKSSANKNYEMATRMEDKSGRKIKKEAKKSMTRKKDKMIILME